MLAQIIVRDAYGAYHVKISVREDLAHLAPEETKKMSTFESNALYFPKSLGMSKDGVPVELIIQDIYEVIDSFEHGISLDHLQEYFGGTKIEEYIEQMISEGIIEGVQMTPKCVIYRKT